MSTILNDTLAHELRELQQRRLSEGHLLSSSQLAACYDTFRRRFGPDALSRLDGEALLKTMHAHGNRDSLVYWLEFKDDNEFPARFGSIAGGSALKFGIYRRRETGTWMAGSSQNQRELSLDEAIQFARNHRDQLLRGAELLSRLPAHAADSDYQQLQDQLNAEAPDVYNVAWSHKYFSLIYPDKLDDFHQPYYQRFHLIKLLQVPPGSYGRYAAAGRYVAIARELGMPLNHLTALLNHRNGRPYRYWRIGTHDGAQLSSRWDMMRDERCVAIGWPALGDLSGLSYNKQSKEIVQQRMAERYPTRPQHIGRAAQQVFNFIMAVSEGDLVLASDGATVLGIGKIVGPYIYDPSSDFSHRRSVEWLSLAEWRLPAPEGLRTTLHEINDDAHNLVAIEQRILRPVIKPPDSWPPKIPRLEGLPGRIQAVLERKGQVVLYGPPGTGKTYWAERTACELAAFAEFGLPFEQLSPEQRRIVIGDGTANGIVRLCSFHPAYGYEDFLEGYRPESIDGQMLFRPRDGIFKKLCGDAQAQPNRKWSRRIPQLSPSWTPNIAISGKGRCPATCFTSSLSTR